MTYPHLNHHLLSNWKYLSNWFLESLKNHPSRLWLTFPVCCQLNHNQANHWHQLWAMKIKLKKQEFETTRELNEDGIAHMLRTNSSISDTNSFNLRFWWALYVLFLFLFPWFNLNGKFVEGLRCGSSKLTPINASIPNSNNAFKIGNFLGEKILRKVELRWVVSSVNGGKTWILGGLEMRILVLSLRVEIEESVWSIKPWFWMQWFWTVTFHLKQSTAEKHSSAFFDIHGRPLSIPAVYEGGIYIYQWRIYWRTPN